ncbi:hypothetical protein COCNU_16G003790 [Cocos nucifera]|uniref:Uncharacterized protein n=1 Tax=Cocos nucifera TaxID=13894 RepID=A0A8K0NDH8_COCNU|nr:hypothetical protein COCNU_16G003790 [Cocos nucifera]
MPEPQHYSDYGFDPQIDYFQALDEARRHRKRSEARSLDALHFKLQKPISKDDSKARKKRRWWWKSALRFWKRAKAGGDEHAAGSAYRPKVYSTCPSYPYRAGSGPLYATESAGSSTHCRTSRPSSGPLAAAEVGAAPIPYLCLRDLNLVDGPRISASAAPAPMPIYLVT